MTGIEPAWSGPQPDAYPLGHIHHMPPAGIEPASHSLPLAQRPRVTLLGIEPNPPVLQTGARTTYAKESRLPRRESNLRHPVCRTRVPPLNYAAVDAKGIEPSSTGCRPVILPLNDTPECPRQDLNPYLCVRSTV